MKKGKYLSSLLVLTIAFSSLGATGNIKANASVKASVIETEQKNDFTNEAQHQIDLLKNFVKDGSVEVKGGLYIIKNSKPINKMLNKDAVKKLEEFIKIFNDGITLGLFEIDTNNNLNSSKKYEKSEPIPVPRIEIIDVDSILRDNGGTMLRTLYINTQSYGANIGTIKTGEFFASKVRPGGSWDYKTAFGVNTAYQTTINGITLRITGEQIGNANYGFTGRKVFGANLLKSAAGAVQIYTGTSYIGWYNSYFDDPIDQRWIDRGISYSQGGSF